jgi:hypothetical protein
MININTRLDGIMVDTLIKRHMLNHEVVGDLDQKLYLPMVRLLISSIKSNLKRQLKA